MHTLCLLGIATSLIGLETVSCGLKKHIFKNSSSKTKTLTTYEYTGKDNQQSNIIQKEISNTQQSYHSNYNELNK